MRTATSALAAISVGLLCTAQSAAADTTPPSTSSESGCGGDLKINYALRYDFNSINTIICSKKEDYLPQAEGAQIGFTTDQLARTSSASGEGVAAAYMNVIDRSGEWFAGLTLGAYLQGDGSYQFGNSHTPLKRSDSVTEGGFAQIGFMSGTFQNYFRFRGGKTEASSGIDASTFVGEWIPTFSTGTGSNQFGFNEGMFIPWSGGTFLYYVLTPELMVQSDHLDDGPAKYRLFSTNHSAFRIGPQVSLAVSPYGTNSFLDNFTLSEVYHYSEDTISNRDNSWSLTTLSYNITTNFGLSLSYGAGNSEATANTSSQIKAGLSIKF